MMLYCARCQDATLSIDLNGHPAHVCPQCGAVYAHRYGKIYSMIADLHGAQSVKDLLHAKEDLLVPAHLTKADWPVVSTLPYRVLEGSYNQTTGKVTVIRPSEKLPGVPSWAEKEPPAAPALDWLKIGETVLLIRTEDGQTYCVVERMVRPDEPVSAD